MFLKKWANHGLFLIIFVLFKHKFFRKTVGVNRIRTRIIGVEGEHADHLTTTSAQEGCYISILLSLIPLYVYFPSIL